jgi:lipoprotein-anchoring transpeptidase ErfK/SrfK
MSRPQRSRRRRVLGAAVLGAAVLAAALLVAVVFTPRPSASASKARAIRANDGVDVSALPDPVHPAFTPPKPRPLPRLAHLSRSAPIRRPVAALDEPRAGARSVAALSTRTEEGTTNIVLVLGRAKDASGRLWIHVRLPVLPNNTTGWVPRSALGGYSAVRTHLVVDLERLDATLYRDGKPIFEARIGVGQPSSPTPKGSFYIRDRITTYASPFYGPLAFGTSARSSVLTDWPDGGFIGIHGTDQPQILPGRVSHGCIRLRNADILRLGLLMPVGTPLTIE